MVPGYVNFGKQFFCELRDIYSHLAILITNPFIRSGKLDRNTSPPMGKSCLTSSTSTSTSTSPPPPPLLHLPWGKLPRLTPPPPPGGKIHLAPPPPPPGEKSTSPLHHLPTGETSTSPPPPHG